MSTKKKFHGDWLFNTDESEKPGAYHRMLSKSCIAAWGIGYNANSLLSRPSPGDRVFFYLDKVGIIAKAYFTDKYPFQSNDIFEAQNRDEFQRPVVNLSFPKRGYLPFSFILNQTGYHLPVKGLALCKIHDSSAAEKIASLICE